MAVYFVKLVTGEEMLATLEQESENEILIADPLEVRFDDMEDGRTGVMLGRYTPFIAGHKINLWNDHVMMLEPVPEAVSFYYEKSLKYIRERNDKNFAEGIVEAAAWLDEEPNMEDLPEDAELDAELIQAKGFTIH